MKWSLQNITKWSGYAHDPAHTDPKTGKKKFSFSLKIFFSRTETAG
jgi:hypothetical protein